MNASFGPWSTAITTGANHQLSTFWKRRLTMLASIHSLPSRAARRTWILLALAATLALMWPTIHAAPVAPKSTYAVENGVIAVEYLPRPSSEEAKILRALEMPVDVDFSETPLEDCLKSLAQKARIPIVLDTRRLADENLALDVPISLSLHGRTLELVLKRLFETYAVDEKSPGPDFGFLIEEDELKITTAVSVEGSLPVRWYPVWDLWPAVGSDPANQPSSARATPGFGSASRLQIAAQRRDFSLMDAITTTIQPDSWEDLSGPGSMVYASDLGCLVIRQTQSAHREIVKLLRLWREARGLKRAAAAGDVRRVTE